MAVANPERPAKVGGLALSSFGLRSTALVEGLLVAVALVVVLGEPPLPRMVRAAPGPAPQLND